MSAAIWDRRVVALIDHRPYPAAPLIAPADVPPLIPGMDLWDLWPVQNPRGEIAPVAGGVLFMLLSAPALPDPEDRHAVARIRLMHRVGAEWRDLGFALPDDLSPGSREWAGSAVLADDHASLTLYFTAAGRRAEPAITFEQRLFECQARLTLIDGIPSLVDWSTPHESVAADGDIYLRDMSGGGAIGTIKAFRDPAWFRDPADQAEYLLFTGSLAQSRSNWNGAIGLAKRASDGWQLLTPLITADGLNNELERPHVVFYRGRYHCFWSTQRKVFAEDGPSGPNGLYGMVADSVAGPWTPLNGTGLVLGNPPEAPYQAYSWLVRSDLTVLSFADLIGTKHRPNDASEARARFAGTPAPFLRLGVEGDRTWLA